eukprot:CAMPEP_0176386886 /NCGR_PEP_ID=MMETSP0126-20121128/36303_1 /TAXON_ID=141414 ORGANISM="Strombidinopsis acuminatum, Strain SPMC142" /NCGR_SAMPLE_ID=MMETSP0126 /ASSEMBLY_ACC=CAM_ASM_000229 /LENGTH=135 /DNA_ID=CAMNT_0017754105 /DNA_START=1342 /DNA_END=1749 /DNA_ORIENTATION=-
MLILLPGDMQQISQSMEELEELKDCFVNLKLGSKKYPLKRTKANDEERAKAHEVLFDLLISLLAKQQSFLRELANFVFKHFCNELDKGTLANLIKIISTPNDEASGFMDDEEEDDYDDEEDSDDDIEDDDDEDEM